MEYTNTLGTNIARLRKEKQSKQEELAQYVGVSAQAVSKWENGGLPDTELLPKIADFFGVSLDVLFGRTVEKRSTLWEMIHEEIHSDDKDKLKAALDVCYLVQNALADCETPDAPFEEGFCQIVEVDGQYTQAKYYCGDVSYFFLFDGKREELLEKSYYPALFADLADENFFKSLGYLMKRSSKSDFTRNLFIKQIGLSQDEATAVIDKLKKYSLIRTSTVEMDDEEIEMYKCGTAHSFWSFLTFAKELPQPSKG